MGSIFRQIAIFAEEFDFFCRDGFFFQQTVGNKDNLILMLQEDFFGVFMGFINDLADRLINFISHLGREVLLGVRIVATKEDRSRILFILNGAKFGHTEFGNHQTSQTGCFFDVVRSPSRNILEEDFFGGASTKQARDLSDEFVLCHEETVIFRSH